MRAHYRRQRHTNLLGQGSARERALQLLQRLQARALRGLAQHVCDVCGFFEVCVCVCVSCSCG